jgi:uncharacterized protein YceK
MGMRWTRSVVVAIVAVMLVGCNSTQPRVSPGQGSYYSGNGGACWGEMWPGGPRGNLCGQGGGHGSRP